MASLLIWWSTKRRKFCKSFYRNHRTPVFKTDHPDLSFKNQGHLLNPNKEENMALGKARMYTEWEPPKGGEARDGKKIIVEKPDVAGVVHKELDW